MAQQKFCETEKKSMQQSSTEMQLQYRDGPCRERQSKWTRDILFGFGLSERTRPKAIKNVAQASDQPRERCFPLLFRGSSSAPQNNLTFSSRFSTWASATTPTPHSPSVLLPNNTLISIIGRSEASQVMAALDPNQLQAELELKRSALADSILSKLPGLGGSDSSLPQQQQSASSSSRPRQANLGLGATPKQQPNDSTDANGKPRSAADLRLKGALTSKRKRWQDHELATSSNGEESGDDQVSRADAIGASKKSKSNGNMNGADGGKGKAVRAGGEERPFRSKRD